MQWCITGKRCSIPTNKHFQDARCEAERLIWVTLVSLWSSLWEVLSPLIWKQVSKMYEIGVGSGCVVKDAVVWAETLTFRKWSEGVFAFVVLQPKNAMLCYDLWISFCGCWILCECFHLSVVCRVYRYFRFSISPIPTSNSQRVKCANCDQKWMAVRPLNSQPMLMWMCLEPCKHLVRHIDFLPVKWKCAVNFENLSYYHLGVYRIRAIIRSWSLSVAFLCDEQNDTDFSCLTKLGCGKHVFVAGGNTCISTPSIRWQAQ